MKKVKTFVFKSLFILAVGGIGVAWFLQSDVGQDIQLVEATKNFINQSIKSYTNEKKTEVISYLDQKKHNTLEKVKDKLKTVGLGEDQEVVLSPPIENKPSAPKDIKIVKKKDQEEHTTELITKNEETKKNEVQEFKHLSIPFYYDHSSAPSNLSKEQVLSLVKKASDTWNTACNISFDYKGDRLTDYVDTSNTIRRNEGLIKWGGLPGNAIGQAHQGNGYSYAKGFVLTLKPNFFAHASENMLYSTILHESGHVIGLPHSKNSNSIMFWQQSNRKQVLNDTDKIMCKYFRSRWQGLSSSQAADKYGLLINESTTNEEVSTEDGDDE